MLCLSGFELYSRWLGAPAKNPFQVEDEMFKLTWYGNMIEFICFFETLLNDSSKISFSKWFSHNISLSYESTLQDSFLSRRNNQQVMRGHFGAFFLGVNCIFFTMNDKAMKGILRECCVIVYAIQMLQRWTTKHPTEIPWHRVQLSFFFP